MQIQRVLIFMALLSHAIFAQQVCDLTFTDCPKTFNGKTLVVGNDIKSIAAKIRYCTEGQVVSGGTSEPVSIVFIIDNSGSMRGGDGNDPSNARFNVVPELIDTLYKISPDVEVGLVVFTRRLLFDDRVNPYFKSLFNDGVQHDGYVPLTALNKSFGNGKLGVDTLKAFLKINPNVDLVNGLNESNRYAFTNGRRTNANANDSTNIKDGTDINLGFEAARAAMASSKFTDKNKHFFIFLSDGEPSGVDKGRPAQDLFRYGRNVPTTFTIFFNKDPKAPAPGLITEMTDSIKINHYSTISNPKSKVTTSANPKNELKQILFQNVFSNIIVNSKANQFTLNDRVSTTSDGTDFTFSKRYPLNADKTDVKMQISYNYSDNNVVKSKTDTINFTVQRSATATLAPGLDAVCHAPATVALYSNGQPITTVLDEQKTLEARVTLPTGETCIGCFTTLSSSNGTDIEKLNLAANKTILSGNFNRSINSNPSKNGALEHAETDNIILVYHNADVPLDTIRVSYPFKFIPLIPGDLVVSNHNTVAKPQISEMSNDSHQWTLVGPSNLQVESSDATKCCKIIDAEHAKTEFSSYVGFVLQASRAFSVDVKVFDHLGLYINKLHLKVSQNEFDKLPKGSTKGTSTLSLLWNSRTEDGGFVGTGVYIFKTQMHLEPLAGAKDADSSFVRTYGVLRASY